MIGPVRFVPDQPAVECSQGFLDQDDLGKAGLPCGFQGQVPGHLVKGGGNGDDHRLALQIVFLGITHGHIPGFTDVFEKRCRRMNR